MDHEQHVRETWAALSRGDLETVEAAFAANGRWRAVEDGEWNCENRTQILNVMRENRARRVLEGDVEEVLDVGKHVVLSLDNGLVTEMKGCLNRQVALDYAAT